MEQNEKKRSEQKGPAFSHILLMCVRAETTSQMVWMDGWMDADAVVSGM
jgi:hypothetical protein